MQKPTVEEILNFMAEKLGGEDNIPMAIKYAKTAAPELIYQVAFNSKSSVGDENSPFDEKTRVLIFLAAALAMKDIECIKTQVNAAIELGATKEELIAVIKIVKHAAHSSIIGYAEPILEKFIK